MVISQFTTEPVKVEGIEGATGSRSSVDGAAPPPPVPEVKPKDADPDASSPAHGVVDPERGLPPGAG